MEITIATNRGPETLTVVSLTSDSRGPKVRVDKDNHTSVYRVGYWLHLAKHADKVCPVTEYVLARLDPNADSDEASRKIAKNQEVSFRDISEAHKLLNAARRAGLYFPGGA